MSDEFEWEYRESERMLKIESFRMPDYLAAAVEANGAIESIGPEEISTFLPWAAFKNDIQIIEARNLVSVPPAIFAWMPQLTYADIPNAQIIGNSAFFSCPLLETVQMENVQLIGNSSFSQCKSLERTSSIGRRWIELRTCRHVSAFAFQGCKSITSVTFKKKGKRIADDGHIIQEAGTFLEFIGECAFADCVKMKSVALGGKEANVIIGNNAFYKCPLSE